VEGYWKIGFGATMSHWIHSPIEAGHVDVETSLSTRK